MALGKRLINTGGVAACTTDSVDPFGDSSGVALYSLDYDASTAPDGTDYSGTPTNVDFGVGGAIGAYGARFNGSSSYITADKSMFGTGDGVANLWSISLWFKTDGSVTASRTLIATKGSGSQAGFFLYMISGGQIRYYEGNTSTNSQQLTTTATYDDSNWHNIVITRSGTTDVLTMYIDGTEVISPTTMTNPHTSHNFNLHIGRYPASATFFWDGSIDQLRIFSKALDSNEVSTLYAETACVYTSTTDIVNYPTGTTPVAYYKLDNSSEDFSTGGNDGTDTNVEYRFGRFGQAAVFNGSSSRIDISSLSLFDRSSFAISCWAKSTNVTTTGRIIGHEDTGGSAIIIRGDDVIIDARDNGASASITLNMSTTNNQWHHICLVNDSNHYYLYLDGVEVDDNNYGYNPTASTAGSGHQLAFGYRKINNDSYWSGDLDQVRIYSTALSSSQVTELYNEKPEVDTSNFKTVLYEGTGATQYISNVGFEPDLVWLKCRNVAKDHRIYDSVRGATKFLEANNTDAEATASTSLTSFDSNGFTLGAASTTNSNNDTFIAWNWKAGGLAVSNTDGTDITSQVSANTGAGFSIVKWTGTGDDTDTIGHGLDPNGESMIVIMKDLDSSSDWMVITNNLWSTPTTSYLKLNTTQAVTTGSGTPYLVNNTVFKNTNRNISGNEHIAYCFHSVAGYSKIGTYTSTGVSGQEITGLGFAPSFVMIKNAGDVGSWIIHDKARNPNNPSTKHLRANSNSTEDTGANEQIDFDSDGFTLNGTGQNINHSDLDTYIYLAFA